MNGQFRQITEMITLGPDYVIVPGLNVPPSREMTPCGFCDERVDVCKRHAISIERYDGRVTAGRFVHIHCAQDGAVLGHE
jgi:hypothetical protein